MKKKLSKSAENKKKDKPEGYVFGRPTKFTQEIADEICRAVSTNPVGYDTILKLYPHLPTKGVVSEWRLKHKQFGADYLLAKSFQSQIMVEEIDEILPHEIRTYFDEKGNERIDAPSASLAIAKANNRKWTAARLAPRVYGDQKTVEEVTSENIALKEEMKRLREELDAKNKKEF